MGRYTTMKIKLLLWVFFGAAAVLFLTLGIKEFIIEGLMEGFFQKAFLWIATRLFAVETGRAAEVYQVYIHDNKTVWLLCMAIFLMLVAFYCAMGQFTRWLDDVSEAVRQVGSERGEEFSLAKELAPIEDDLRGIQKRLVEREQATVESEARRKDLIAFLAHDLKTPLTSVLGYLNLLHDQPNLSTEDRAKYTDIALSKAVRLEELVREFFDISRMDLGQTSERCAVSLTMMLGQMVEEFYPAMEDHGLTWDIRLLPNMMVWGEADKLARVFENILRNAVNYSHSGGRVEVLTHPAIGGQVEVVVRNQGLTIPEEELAQIFEKFYRSDGARSTKTGGAGLGLAIAKEIVEHHGGTIRAESDGQMTSFIIRLPRWNGALRGGSEK